jgi:phosphoribosyl 1,2-cyclic phosphodiesterase
LPGRAINGYFVSGMSLYICSLNSGSNGNCYYVGNDREAVLIDAGISCRETEKRMARAGLEMRSVKAIFISHEHSDHIRGLEVLSRKHRLPVYVTGNTLRQGGLALDEHLAMPLDPSMPVQVGGLHVRAFPKYHDASDPHSFTVSFNDIRVGIFTDIGRTCKELIRHFSGCHAAFLESNYDEQMLRQGPYPAYLKKRISGGQGHLSNAEALQLFLTYRRPDLSHLILSHLSAENNCPVLVKDLFSPHAGDVKVVVASRHEESPVFQVTAGNAPRYRVPSGAEMQMSLF